MFLVHIYFTSLSCPLGTDEATIIEILSSRTSNERQQIKQKYKAMYGKVSPRVHASMHMVLAFMSLALMLPKQQRVSLQLQ